MPEYSQHELRTIAEDYAQLCAALADLRDTALDVAPEDLADSVTSPFAAVELAKKQINQLVKEVDELNRLNTMLIEKYEGRY